jgi:hypothetical protein
MVFIRNKGDYDAYVRSVFAFEAGSDWDFTEFQKKVHLNINTDTDVVVWDWLETPVTIGEGTYFIATATYVDPLKAGQISDISLAQIALDPSVTNEDMAVLGDTYHVLVKSQGIQADGFGSFGLWYNFGFVGLVNTRDFDTLFYGVGRIGRYYRRCGFAFNDFFDPAVIKRLA